MFRIPLVLLPGTLCDATLFEHQVKHLVDVADPRVVDVHLQDNLADVAHYVLSQVEGQFAVAGLSYGGIVAFELWRQARERIAKIALLNTNPYPAAEQTKINHSVLWVWHISANFAKSQRIFSRMSCYIPTIRKIPNYGKKS